MGEELGKINVSKDTMLFVVNDVFKKEIQENVKKEEILAMVPSLYEENLLQFIKMLPDEGYKALEKLLELLKRNNNLEECLNEISYHRGIYHLQEAMILVMRVKDKEYTSSINPGVLEKVESIFEEKNRKIAERYAEIEKLTIGMLYTYGVVDMEFLTEAISKYTNERITQEELEDIYETRLNLNVFVNFRTIRYENTQQLYITYLDELEADIENIVWERKRRALPYKEYTKEAILSRQECAIDDRMKKLYQFIIASNKKAWQYGFFSLLKRNELGEEIGRPLLEMCRIAEDTEIAEFERLYEDWRQNSPQYTLGGFSPNEIHPVEKRRDITVNIEEYIVNIRAAGIIIHDNKVLLHRNVNSDHYALVGGRVKIGENSEKTVKREIVEETGKSVEITGYIATIENFFRMKNAKYHEILFVHKAEFTDEKDKVLEDTIKNIEGKDYLQYEWIDIKDIDDYPVKPEVIKEVLKRKEYPIHIINEEK